MTCRRGTGERGTEGDRPDDTRGSRHLASADARNRHAGGRQSYASKSDKNDMPPQWSRSEREGRAARDGPGDALRDSVPAWEASPAGIAGWMVFHGISIAARERSKKSNGESVNL